MASSGWYRRARTKVGRASPGSRGGSRRSDRSSRQTSCSAVAQSEPKIRSPHTGRFATRISQALAQASSTKAGDAVTRGESQARGELS